MARWLPFALLAIVGTAAPGRPSETRATLAGSWNDPSVQASLERRAGGPLVGLILRPSLNPAAARGELRVEIGPAPLVVRAGVEPAFYFGGTGALISYTSGAEDHGRAARGDRDRAPGVGARAFLGPSLRLRVGPLLAALGAEVEWWRIDAAGPLAYEPNRDALLRAAGDRVLTGSATLLLRRPLRDGSLSAGPALRTVDTRHVTGERMRRLGLVASREWSGRWLGLQRPTLAATVHTYLDHPSKRGQLGLGLSLSFDPRLSRPVPGV